MFFCKILRVFCAALTVSAALFCLPVIAVESAACVANTCFSSPQKSQQFLIAPYLFDPDIEGEAEVQGISAAFDYSVEDLASGINAGGMGYLFWERGPDFFYMEGLGFRYKDRISAFQNKLLSAEIALLEFGYGRNYCVTSRQPNADCSFIISPYIGLRHTQMDISIKLNEGGIEGILLPLAGLPNVYQAQERWLDPAAGTILQYQISPLVRLYTKGDIAGLGVGYNDYWNIMAVLHLQATQHWSIAGGYRVTDFNATPGGGNKIKMDLHGEGPLFGVIYNF